MPPPFPPPSVPPLQKETYIKTQDLCKVYTDFWGRPKVEAVSHLSFDVFRGEIFGLLGPNGSGKTTTTKLLLGLIFPSSGYLEVLGKPPGTIEQNYRIGFLPEESYLYRFLNAEETLHFYGKLFRIPSKLLRERSQELIHELGLDHAKKRRIREYSKGMSRRIGLATALINNPDLIFLDEPTSGMDPLARDLVKGKTVLICTHLLADIEDICDRIAIMKKGRLACYGTVESLLTDLDITRFSVKGLNPDSLEKIQKLLAQESQEILKIDHPKSSLEQLFQRTITQEENVELLD
jgi:ABC-2 type transport system ATP-binding protein